MYNIQLEPCEQEFSIPKLIDRIANPSSLRMTKTNKSFSDFVYELYDENKSEAQKIRLDSIKNIVNGDILAGWLRVTKLFGKEVIQVDALVEWMFRRDGKVTQLGLAGGESYADACLRRLLKSANEKASPTSLVADSSNAPPASSVNAESELSQTDERTVEPNHIVGVSVPVPPETQAVPASGPGWSLKKPRRFQGYSKPLYDLLKADHAAGLPRPTAHDVLDAFRKKKPHGIGEVMPDGLKYDGGVGGKIAGLSAIRKSIDRLTSRLTPDSPD